MHAPVNFQIRNLKIVVKIFRDEVQSFGLAGTRMGTGRRAGALHVSGFGFCVSGFGDLRVEDWKFLVEEEVCPLRRPVPLAERHLIVPGFSYRVPAFGFRASGLEL